MNAKLAKRLDAYVALRNAEQGTCRQPVEEGDVPDDVLEALLNVLEPLRARRLGHPVVREATELDYAIVRRHWNPEYAARSAFADIMSPLKLDSETEGGEAK
jgi:hypothetical protein